MELPLSPYCIKRARRVLEAMKVEEAIIGRIAIFWPLRADAALEHVADVLIILSVLDAAVDIGADGRADRRGRSLSHGRQGDRQGQGGERL